MRSAMADERARRAEYAHQRGVNCRGCAEQDGAKSVAQQRNTQQSSPFAQTMIPPRVHLPPRTGSQQLSHIVAKANRARHP